jgi:hypothetical protein
MLSGLLGPEIPVDLIGGDMDQDRAIVGPYPPDELEEVEGAPHVGFNELPAIGDRVIDVGFGGEVENDIGSKRKSRSAHPFNQTKPISERPEQIEAGCIGPLIDHDDVVAAFVELEDQLPADEAGATRDEADAHPRKPEGARTAGEAIRHAVRSRQTRGRSRAVPVSL